MSNKRFTITEIARELLNVCSERVESYKAHLIELSKREAEITEGKLAKTGSGAGGGVDVVSSASPAPASAPSAPSAPTGSSGPSASPGTFATHLALPGTFAKNAMCAKPKLPRKRAK